MFSPEFLWGLLREKTGKYKEKKGKQEEGREDLRCKGKGRRKEARGREREGGREKEMEERRESRRLVDCSMK